MNAARDWLAAAEQAYATGEITKSAAAAQIAAVHAQLAQVELLNQLAVQTTAVCPNCGHPARRWSA